MEASLTYTSSTRDHLQRAVPTSIAEPFREERYLRNPYLLLSGKTQDSLSGVYRYLFG